MAAQNQANAVNQAAAINARAEAIGALTRRQKAAGRREAKRRQGEPVRNVILPKEVAETVYRLGQGDYPTSRIDINDSPQQGLLKMENAT